MKNQRNLLFISLLLLFFTSHVKGQGGVKSRTFNADSLTIGSGTSNAAVVEMNSTTSGFLPPRMTTAQRDAISNPVDGLLLFNTTTGCINYFFNNNWKKWCGDEDTPSYPTGTVHCNGPTAVVEITNPTTGKIWMDRNLGASQAATSSTDTASYGDLYQWGRGADGHQCRNSNTTSVLSSTDQPAHGDFIVVSTAPINWRSPQNLNLWQGINGVNNPCPNGYRLPTDAELNAELLSWSSNNAAGALASPLKLPMAGDRHFSNGAIQDIGTIGYYWSSTISSGNAGHFFFGTNGASMSVTLQAYGFSVRCIKD